MSDADGSYPSFAGGDSVRVAEGFTYYGDFSLWDTYRALHPLLTLCQVVGQAGFDDGRPGIACRSAATNASPTDEELGVFDRDADASAQMTGRHPFADWFWGEPS